MLFNSYEFIFFFLPVVLIVFFQLLQLSSFSAKTFLVAASLFFYGWWAPEYLLLLLGSIAFNFWLGNHLLPVHGRTNNKIWLVFGIVVNLAALIWFKYAWFIANNLDIAFGTGIADTFSGIILPLAISFFTFQQIAYLVDSARGLREKESFINYILFVTFFPQLIAGPIVHHKEMMPQFAEVKAIHWDKFTQGLMLFFAGLFKKVVIADSIAPFANRVFSSAEQGVAIQSLEAWGGALAYTFQLYFDFSGYADMAIGLGLMFGIALPLNFNSPYKSLNIIDFWRRWHMTLGRFLRDYLYIPLGGNRGSSLMRYRNLFLTMLIGGIWHGAGWNFLIWGALHGSYLVVNHGWHYLKSTVGISSVMAGPEKLASWLITFVAAVVAWVFFRATDLQSALSILNAMFYIDAAPMDIVNNKVGAFGSLNGFLVIGLAGLISFLAPNTCQIFSFGVEVSKSIAWRRSALAAIVMSAISVVALLYINSANEFLYFQF